MALTKNQKYTLLGLGVAVLGGTAYYISRVVK